MKADVHWNNKELKYASPLFVPGTILKVRWGKIYVS